MSTRSPRTGDPCPTGCGGRLRIYSGRDLRAFRVAYFRCSLCGAKPIPPKSLTPLADVYRRKRKPKRPWWSSLIS